MSKKGLSGGDIRHMAHTMVDSLRGREDYRPVITSILAESPGARREIVEEAVNRVRDKRLVLMPDAVTWALQQLLDPGQNCKSDYVGRYLQQVFEATMLAPPAARQPLLGSLVSTFLTIYHDSVVRPLPPSAFSALAESRQFMSGLVGLLTDQRAWKELSASFSIWGPSIIPEIVVRMPELSGDASTALLTLLRENEPLTAAMQLSRDAIVRKLQPPQSSETVSTSRPEVSFEDSNLSALYALVLENLKLADASIAARLQSLSDACSRLDGENADLRRDLLARSDAERTKQIEFRSLEKKLGQQQAEADAHLQQIVSLEKKNAEYSRQFGALAEGADQRLADQEAATKRIFAERQMSALRSLRDYLEKLGKGPDHANAELAIINYNKLLRFLHSESYIQRAEIVPIPLSEEGRP